MQKSGFFNALLTNGEYDRKYNANDYCDNLAVVISNGVLRSTNDDLRVTAAGMVVTVGVGRAWINGHYYLNDTPHSFAAVSAPIGGARYDRVVLRLNKNLAVRSVSLVYQQGEASDSPVAPVPVREGDIYDIVLADVYVGTNATNVVVTDRRSDAELCGWVYSTSGDGSFFASLDAAFDEWFEEKKNTLSSVTLFKRYNWRTVLEGAGNTVTFSIPQYDAETCFIELFVNGLIVTEGVDFTVSGAIITFAAALVAGTEIEVKCYKSIDGTGIMSVADEITELQNAILNINTAGNYFYNCNGINDNVVISEMAQEFINGGDDMGELTITVVGTFGAVAPNNGDGRIFDPYIWFNIGNDNVGSRRVVLDFSGCTAVNLTQGTGYYSLFKGRQYTVKNLCLNIDGAQSYINGQPLYEGNKNVYLERCKINARIADGWLFNYGTFRDCEFTVKSTGSLTAVFRLTFDGDLLRIYGGEHCAYTADTEGIASVIYVGAEIAKAVVIADGISCPLKTVSGYVQRHAVYDETKNGYSRYLNIVTGLFINAVSQVVRDAVYY